MKSTVDEAQQQAPPPQQQTQQQQTQQQAQMSVLEGLFPSFRDVVSGTAAGASICLVGHPFDTVKVRLQTQDMAKPSQDFRPFKGGLDCAVRTVKKEGLLALYKGMSGPIITVPLINAVVFASYEQGKRFFEQRPLSSLSGRAPANGGGAGDAPRTLDLWEISLAGGWAGFVNSFVVGPVELVKSRLQVQYGGKGSNPAHKGPWQVTRDLVRSRGIRGLFLGMNVTILREVPGYVAQFYVYEYLKRAFTPPHTPGGPPPEASHFGLMTAGGVSGIFSWTFSYPQDIIKSRIQVQADGAAVRYPPRLLGLDGGMLACGREIYRASGWRGFWVGFGPCAARAVPANAVGFLTYELVSKFMLQSSE